MAVAIISGNCGLSPRVRGKPAREILRWPAGRSIPACAGEAAQPLMSAAVSRVYPRVCGGSVDEPWVDSRIYGLSPRVRGKLDADDGCLHHVGSIPACAGEATPLPVLWTAATVYPRVCGGSGVVVDVVTPDVGLSPRVRGKPLHPSLSPPHPGSIPACAGEAGNRRRRGWRRGVYPRVCGGSWGLALLVQRYEGLSPRVRGKRESPRRWTGTPRSIPACAGEASAAVSAIAGGAVYPRVCGGSQAPRRGWRSVAGLSPRVRGKRVCTGASDSSSGSIPACAGEAGGRWRGACGQQVYPRVCGGSFPSANRTKGRPGLSPRVRGKRLPAEVNPGTIGSIPACAGEARWVECEHGATAVYPRVCGGSAGCGGCACGGDGLSPRVRGKLAADEIQAAYLGSIPACAGEAAADASALAPPAVYPRVCGGSRCREFVFGLARGLSPRVRGKRPAHLWLAAVHGSIPACAGEAAQAFSTVTR